ncbi:MAG: radical SAM protein [Candidatus Moraniibacteriota bacterium]|jgi:MoaA/NifB/PqqE/SkfB family radical SAM enzyme
MLNVDKLYRVRWNTFDNANAMVEPTTFCQLNCPKCYREVGKEGSRPINIDLDIVRKEIDELKKIRNIETVTLAGGDPLLYPHIIKLVKYCRKINIKVRICTNGILLDSELLIKLRNAGTNEVLIHLDKYQGRGDENEQYAIRKRFCELFREFPEVNLGFMVMIRGVEEDNLERLASFYIANSDVIRLVSFIFTKDIRSEQVQANPNTENLEKLIVFLSARYNCSPAAYFGKKINKKIPSWLIFVPVFSDGRAIGYIDSSLYAISSKLARLIKGKHWFLTNKNTINPYTLFFGIFNLNARKILKNYTKESIDNKFSNRMNYQIITVNYGPDQTSEGWDLCDPCPDAILYDGKLVPSCLLERIKEGENIQF